MSHPRRQALAAGLLLAGATLLVFRHWLFSGRALYWGDMGLYFFPMVSFLREQLQHGILPLWNPRIFSGVPFVGNPQMWPLYPSTALLGLMPASRFLTVSCVLHVFLAGLFTFLWLARGRMALPFWAALLGAVTYMFGGFLTTKAQYPNMLQALAYVPLILWRVESLAAAPGLRTGIWAGLALGLQILTSHAQITLYTLYIAVFYGLLCLWRSGRPLLLPLVTSLLATGLLAISLSCGQWLPVLEAHRWTARQTLTISQVNRQHLPLMELSNFVQPWRYGSPMHGDYSAPGAFWETACYAGVLPLALAALSLAGLGRSRDDQRERRADIGFWLAASVISTWLALGEEGGLFRLVYAVVPGMKLFHDPVRLLLGAAVGLPVLAAFGLERAERLLTTKMGKTATEGHRPSPAFPTLLGAVAVGLVMLDLGNFDDQIYPLAPVAVLENLRATAVVPHTLFSDQTLAAGTGRILTIDNANADQRWLVWTRFAQNDPNYLSRLADTLMPDQEMGMGFCDLGGYEPLVLRNSLYLFDQADSLMQSRGQDQPHPPGLAAQAAPLLGRMGVRDVIAYRPQPLLATPGLTPLFASADPDRQNTVYVYRNQRFLPRARYLWVSPNGSASLPQPASIASDTPDRVEVLLPSRDQPAMLTLADTAFPSWSATLDGRPVPVDQGNGFYRVVWVPAARTDSDTIRRIVFRFRPEAFVLGLYVTGLAVLFLAASGTVSLTRRFNS